MHSIGSAALAGHFSQIPDAGNQLAASLCFLAVIVLAIGGQWTCDKLAPLFVKN